MTRPLIEVRDLEKRFDHQGREVAVLRRVSLDIHAGEMVCVVGPSGAGKSTLLHLLGTLDLPSAGQIRYDGEDVTRLSSRKLAAFRNTHIGFVFQFHHLLPEFNAIENVMMPGLVRGKRRGPLEARAKKLLDEVGLSHRATHRPGELSGGEQQRVAIARALLMEPKVILADEPSGNLDSKTGDDVHDLFFSLNRDRGVTICVITHSRDLAARMPRVVTMRDGEIVNDERRTPDAEPTAPAGPAPSLVLSEGPAMPVAEGVPHPEVPSEITGSETADPGEAASDSAAEASPTTP